MKTIVIVGIVIILILVGVLTFKFTGNSVSDSPTSPVPAPGFEDIPEMIVNADSGSESPTTFTVEITSSGFSPRILEISSGDTVTWTNRDSRSHWPASAVHPTHTIYSEFDARRGLSPGGEYSFTFERIGEWNYHDHLSPSLTGTIIVN